MDTTNLSGTQNIQVNCINTASNTNPTACASWGSYHNIDTCPQATPSTAYYPGVPSSSSQDNREKNFPMQQPLFSSPPFLPPFFNSTITPNFYFGQNSGISPPNIPSNNAPNDEKSEKLNRQPSPQPEIFALSDNTNQKMADSKLGVDPAVAPHYPPHHCLLQPPVELQRNPFFIQCACNNSIPWTCNPFIVPMISYYVLWNSYRANALSAPVEPPWTQGYGPQREYKEPDHPSSLNKTNSPVDSGNIGHPMSEKIKEGGQGEFWVRKKSKTILDNDLTEDSFISLSISSLNCTEENVFTNAKNNNEISYLMTNNSIESHLVRSSEKIINERKEVEVEGDKNYGYLETEIQTLKIETHFVFDSQSSVCNAVQQDSNSTVNKNQSKTKISENYVSSSAFQTPVTDDSLERKISSNSSKKSDSIPEESVINDTNKEKKSKTDTNSCNLKDNSKKSIKNFTMTEKKNREAGEKSEVVGSTAAAGDLGEEVGVNCLLNVGNPESVPVETKETNEETSKSSNLDSTCKIKRKNPEAESKSVKPVLEKTKSLCAKSPRDFKSGIANLSSLRELRPKFSKNTEPKKPKEKEPIVVKLKHNCGATKTQTEVKENSGKIQKPKIATAVKEVPKVPGTPKQKGRSDNVKVQPPKTPVQGKKVHAEVMSR